MSAGKEIQGLQLSTPFLDIAPSSKLLPSYTHIIGVCFDGTSCYRAGSKDGPRELRAASQNLETYSPYLEKDLEGKQIVDIGNLEDQGESPLSWYKKFDSIFEGVVLSKEKIKLLTLGGEHSISYAPIKKYLGEYDDLVVVHLDAHADLRDGYRGEHFSHASIIRRICDHLQNGHKIIQYGIRSGTKEEFEWMEEMKTLCHSLDELILKLENIAVDRPIYLTLDLDFFDPSEVPGTGTPEAGGESFQSFIRILKVLNTKNIVGADIVELAPNLDPTGRSSCLASKVARELLLIL
ncbi:MAG: agmatinase [Bacteriovoracaceae bacterium]|jgi:agmatinase|nr:agmatinase [Bacteriovoracaceae bacterium]